MFYRLVLEYDGTDFAGWQVQARGERTVQGTLIEALEHLSGGRARVTGSGRTDAGVHAEGQVAGVALERDFGPEELMRALNALLPADVAVREAHRAAEDFDARRHAVGKIYRYGVWNAAVPSPLRLRRWHHVAAPLDVAAMARAAGLLVGEHDFAAFQAAGSDVVDSVRELRRFEVGGQPGSEIVLECEGGGFLRKMVRNLVGTLLEVGHGRRDAGSMTGLLASRERGLAGATAPARGLCLVAVHYPESPGDAGAR